MSGYPDLALYIDGHWLTQTRGGTMPVHNPADETVLGTLPLAGRAELDAALAAAERGFSVWRRMRALDRFAIIRRATDLMRERAAHIGRLLTLEQGKPTAEAVREVTLSADIIDFLAEEAKRLPGRTVPPRTPGVLSQTVVHPPVGPVAAFTPWNFPVNLPSRKLGGALAAGCSVILKPAEETPASAMEIVRCFHDAGLPAGVLNLVCGVPAEVSSHLIASPVIRKVSFTGSVPVGKQLGELAARGMKRYTAELGGHAPVIVCADADPAAVVKASIPAKYRNAGQVCASPVRFLVHASKHAAFVEAFVAQARALKVGDGLDPATQLGPLAHARRLQEMERFVDDARSRGGRVLCGGTRPARKGWFFDATVVADPAPDSRLMQVEPFGPIAAIESFETLDDAIARANALPYGLAAYAFTRDLASAHRLGEEIEAGMVGINHFGVSQPETPFGGCKESGHGQESGQEGLLGYCDVKLVSVAA